MPVQRVLLNTLALAVSGLVMSCGSDASQTPETPTTVVASRDNTLLLSIFMPDTRPTPQETGGGCVGLKLRLFKNATALRRTDEFKEVEKTPEAKALVATAQRAYDAHCVSLMGMAAPPPGPAEDPCPALMEQLSGDYVVLSQTPQWKVMEQTDRFKTVQQDVTEGDKRGCFKLPSSLSANLN